MEYNELPKNIKTELFKVHTHAELVSDKEIIYKEQDVIDIISRLL